MSSTVDMLAAKSSLSRLVHALETGLASEFIIARNGRPAARLVPLAPLPVDRQRRIGAARGRFALPVDIDAANDAVRHLLDGGAA